MERFTFDFIGRRRIWYVLSSILIIPGILALIVWHLNVGIDFKGGTVQDISFNTAPNIEDARLLIGQQHIKGVNVQTSGKQDILVRFPEQQGIVARVTGNSVATALKTRYPDARESSFTSIGSSVAADTIKQALYAVTIASLAIILFIAFSF